MHLLRTSKRFCFGGAGSFLATRGRRRSHSLHFERLEPRDLLAVELVISEFMADNDAALVDENGDASDWMEIYNPAQEAVSADGWFLTDDAGNLARWRLPAVTIPADGYLVIYASGKDRAALPGPLHTNFKLRAEGEYFALVRPDRSVAHAYAPQFPPQQTDVAYGLAAASTQPGYLAAPTPGAANREVVYHGVVAPLMFSAARGFYEDTFELAITTATEGAEIRYTTDGTAPTSSSGMIYSSRLTISGTTTLRVAAFKPGMIPTNVETHTYLFARDILRQSASFGRDGQGLQPYASWGHTGRGDWDVDPDIVQHPNPSDRLHAEDLQSAPSFAITLPWEDMFGDESRGIYIQDDGIERVASIELIDPQGAGFQQNGSVEIQGGSSAVRWKVDKLSLQLKFQSHLDDGTPTGGPDKLEYRLYDDSPISRFDNVILDAVLNQSFHYPAPGERDRAKYIQDQYIADLHNAMGGQSPFGRFAHVYLNGLYWGMYYVHDRPDHAWAAELFGGDKDEYHAIKHWPYGAIHHGNGNSATDSYLAMLAAAQSVRGDPTSLEKWQTLERQLDIDTWITYLMANWFGGNSDWPQKNWYATARDGGPWRFHSWDAEISVRSSIPVGASPSDLHALLAASAEYRTRMADLIHRHFFDGGALTTTIATRLWIDRMQEIDRMIVGESARWGDNRREPPYTRSDWLNVVGPEGLFSTFFPTRSSLVLDRLRSAGLYPAAEAPRFPQPHETLLRSDHVEIVAPAGTIYFTLDGTDPRQAGGTVAASALRYDSPFHLLGSAAIRARSFDQGEWSALSQASFEVISDSLVRITEINYDPYDASSGLGPRVASADNDPFEFVEISNTSSTPVDLSGMQFVQSDGADDAQADAAEEEEVEGIIFHFAPQLLAPGEHVVVMRDRAAFESRYGVARRVAAGSDGRGGIEGQYAGGLGNGGERLTLLDAFGAIIQSFRYGSDGRWPARAGGLGSSLEMVDPTGDDRDPDNWRSSAEVGGSPGIAGLGTIADVLISEVLARTRLTSGDAIELLNTTDATIDVSGWYLSDSADNYLKFTIPQGTVLGAHDRLVLQQRDFEGPNGSRASDLALNGSHGDALWLVAADPLSGRAVRFVDQVDFDATQFEMSLGRWPDDDWRAPLVPLQAPTLGLPNTQPVRAGVVLSEIHYNPAAPVGLNERFAQPDQVAFLPQQGTWAVSDGRYRASPTSGDGSDPLAVAAQLGAPGDDVRIRATVHFPSATKHNQNGAILFDYHGPQAFKFASLHAGSGRWRIGERDERGWTFLAEIPEPIELDADLSVVVELTGTLATVHSQGLLKVSYDFGEPLADGLIGLGSKSGEVMFDDVHVESLIDEQMLEFIELAGTSDLRVELEGWRLAGAVDWIFAPGTSLRRNETLVVVGFDPANLALADRFRRRTGIAESVMLVGPYEGVLHNDGDTVKLLLPADPGDAQSGFMLADRADYNDTRPWPTQADGRGRSLSRKSAIAPGSSPASWFASVPGPGATRFASLGDMNFDGQTSDDDLVALVFALRDAAAYEAQYGAPAGLAGDADGDGDLDFDDIASLVALLVHDS